MNILPSKLDLADDHGCFVCGKDNPIGLKLDFAIEGEEYVTYFTPQKEHQGWVGIVHGGIMSTILDEVMARYAYVKGYNAVTGEITVRLRKPAQIGNKLRFAGRINSVNRRIIDTSASATDESGQVIAEATGKIIMVA